MASITRTLHYTLKLTAREKHILYEAMVMYAKSICSENNSFSRSYRDEVVNLGEVVRLTDEATLES